MLTISTGENNPLLRKKAAQIDKITLKLRQLVGDMMQTMKQADGIGIAAPQVGKSLQLFVVDPLAFDKERSKWDFRKINHVPDVSKPLAFINPVISTYPKLSEPLVEGCLSLPGLEGSVIRSKRITIKAQTLEGEPFKLQAKGLLAKVLQHEYDHLQGTLICDKWQNARKVKKEKRLRIADRYLNIVFFGDSEYSKIVLEKLKGTPFEPKLIIGKTTPYSLLPTPLTLGITASYGKIIPPGIISKFSKGILNIHPSLLPRYRGPSPLQQTIINGDTKTGVTIALLTNKVDAGPLIVQEEVRVDKAYNTQELGALLFERGANLLKEILPDYLKGILQTQEQQESRAIYTPLIAKNDGLIDWQEEAVLIERKIRAYQPWPVAYTFFEHRGRMVRLQILQARITENLTPYGKVGKLDTTNKKLIVACGNGSLEVIALRPEGKKQMSGEEFIQGYAPETFFSQSA